MEIRKMVFFIKREEDLSILECEKVENYFI